MFHYGDSFGGGVGVNSLGWRQTAAIGWVVLTLKYYQHWISLLLTNTEREMIESGEGVGEESSGQDKCEVEASQSGRWLWLTWSSELPWEAGSEVLESPELRVWRSARGGGRGESGPSVPPLLWVDRQLRSSTCCQDWAGPGQLWVSVVLRCWSMKKVFTQKWNSLEPGEIYFGLAMGNC